MPDSPLRVLVVDDSPDTVESFLMLLQLWGHAGKAAHDGPTALEVARRWQPHVILLDLALPRMDGFEVARRLRREPGLQGVVILATTGHGQPEHRRRCREAGADALLLKPFDPEELQRYLKAGVG